jgi:PqqD family protein of HPr-rel-A system
VVTLDGEAVVYDPATGDLHHLNPTATVVFALCDGTASIPELATEIAETFGEPPTEIEAQVRRLLLRLRRQGLLESADANGNGARSHGR